MGLSPHCSWASHGHGTAATLKSCTSSCQRAAVLAGPGSNAQTWSLVQEDSLLHRSLLCTELVQVGSFRVSPGLWWGRSDGEGLGLHPTLCQATLHSASDLCTGKKPFRLPNKDDFDYLLILLYLTLNFVSNRGVNTVYAVWEQQRLVVLWFPPSWDVLLFTCFNLFPHTPSCLSLSPVQPSSCQYHWCYFALLCFYSLICWMKTVYPGLTWEIGAFQEEATPCYNSAPNLMERELSVQTAQPKSLSLGLCRSSSSKTYRGVS